MSTPEWLADEMEMEDATFLDGTELLDDITRQQLAGPFEHVFEQTFSSEEFSPFIACIQSSRNTSTISSSIPEAASFSDLNCFINLNSKGSQLPEIKATEATNEPKAEKGSKSKRGARDSKEHVIAERKRRAILSQQFVALTSIVPGIRKMDKTTVLDDSIKYLKHLQERVKAFEQQASKKTMESAVFVNKFQVHSDSEPSSTQLLPHIEARASNRNVVIQIHCEKRKGILIKAIQETEKLNLSVVNSSVIPFGISTIDITLMAEMDGGYIVTVKDLVRSLRSSLFLFMGKNLPERDGN